MVKNIFKVEITYLHGHLTARLFLSHDEAKLVYDDALNSVGVKARMFKNDELLTEYGWL